MKRLILTASIAAVWSLPALALEPADVDWSKVAKSELTLFSPGQASWEWIHSNKHPGAPMVRQGKNCKVCHTRNSGWEERMGKKLVSGKKLEPTPIAGKPGSEKVTFQAAFDNEYLYLKASWNAKAEGRYHDYIMYKDGKWDHYGSHRAKKSVRSGKQPAAYEDRFSIMLGDNKGVPEFKNAGCWVTCHNDLRFMPNLPSKKQVAADPILGKKGLHKHDVRKYLPETRTAMDATGGWKHSKSRGELDALRKKGVFLDLWQWRAHRSNPVGMADDGFVSEYRLFDAGKKMFGHNWDKKKGQPKFMFDPAKNGGKPGLTKADIDNPNSSYVLIKGENIVPYDPNYAWKDGDILVRRVLTHKVAGSAGDNNDVHGTWADGKYTLLWKRKLDTGHPLDDVALKTGQDFTIGLAVHVDHVTGRWHYVSFPLTFGLGTGKNDINATSLN